MMKKIFISLSLLVAVIPATGQDLKGRLSKAVAVFEAGIPMKHAMFSLSVEDGSGKVIYQRNPEKGMAVASSQKVLTSVAAFELLGKVFTYRTSLGYTGTIRDSLLTGDLVLIGEGDPSLGSWRWSSTKPAVVLNRWVSSLRTNGINAITGTVLTDPSGFSLQSIPDGWIWQDIGNYYGAGPGKYNWKENQYDVHLRSGETVGGRVLVVNDKDSAGNPGIYLNELKSAARGSGDNANVYLPYGSSKSLVSGTIPVGENNFSISASIPQPERVLTYDLQAAIGKAGISIQSPGFKSNPSTAVPVSVKMIGDYFSPSFDSLNYWFLKRSINLYGEAFVKTIAFKTLGFASTEGGVEIVRDFWAKNGIEKSAIRMMDGSGLSPQNRVTTNALVRAMQYASGRAWFGSFYDALPLINGIKMKSGSIGGARSFTGFIKKGEKIVYVFAIVVNNYDGPSEDIVRKLYSILDILK
ncbi:MAG: D-alanyl-D-alanine carboxypeptidase/D-alanyl-D-alanine-endopeptidase [Chitinophagaceae bacterium]